jgi:hypothetical protein
MFASTTKISEAALRVLVIEVCRIRIVAFFRCARAARWIERSRCLLFAWLFLAHDWFLLILSAALTIRCVAPFHVGRRDPFGIRQRISVSLDRDRLLICVRRHYLVGCYFRA